MGRFYQNIAETIGNTPVVRMIAGAARSWHFVKVEAFNPLGSVKDRLALGVIEAAEKSGELKPGQTVIEATSGNTGIGLMVCAAKVIRLSTMAEPFSVERRKLMRFLGAKVIITPAAERAVGMVNKTIELAKAHGWFMTRQFENEANADIHSRTTAREILDDFAGQRLDYWVTGYGTGGTVKGVARSACERRARNQDRAVRARRRSAAGEWHSAAAASRRLPRRRIRPSSRIPCRAGRRISSPSSRKMRSQPRRSTASWRSPVPTLFAAARNARPRGHLRRHQFGRNLCRRAQDRVRSRKGANSLCMVPDTANVI